MLRAVLERALLVCGGVLFALVVGEGVTEVTYWTIHGHRFPRTERRAAMGKLLAAPAERSTAPSAGVDHRGKIPSVIHPYLGFVPLPAETADGATIGDLRQIPPRSEGELVVGLFGGSFAAGLCNYAGGELQRVLAPPGKTVRLLCLAAGGYKQPQQFLALAYLLAQGAQFDLVLNIDGFNEIALPPVDNDPKGVAPIYPRDWFWRIGTLQDPEALKLLGELSVSERERREWAAVFVRWQLFRSALLTLAWERRDRLFAAERERILAQLQAQKVVQRKSYATTGPTMVFADEESYYRYLARVWKDSSLQMKRLCDANGIAYAHFLQPNQHVEGSKSMGPEERRLAARPGVYTGPVVRGYPRLRQEGMQLANAGVKFRDLTMVFKDVRDPLYSDGCCHLNGLGYVMIARVIGNTVRGGDSNSP